MSEQVKENQKRDLVLLLLKAQIKTERHVIKKEWNSIVKSLESLRRYDWIDDLIKQQMAQQAVIPINGNVTLNEMSDINYENVDLNNALKNGLEKLNFMMPKQIPQISQQNNSNINNSNNQVVEAPESKKPKHTAIGLKQDLWNFSSEQSQPSAIMDGGIPFTAVNYKNNSEHQQIAKSPQRETISTNNNYNNYNSNNNNNNNNNIAINNNKEQNLYKEPPLTSNTDVNRVMGSNSYSEAAKAADERVAGPSSSSSVPISNPDEAVNVVSCIHCSRKFAENRIEKHQSVCPSNPEVMAKKKKRDVMDLKAKRIAAISEVKN